MTLSYANDKLMATIEMLALSQNSLQNKLAAAFTGELVKLQDSCFPPDLLPRWHSIIARLRDASDVSRPQAVMNLSDYDARELIQQIYVLSINLQRRVNIDDLILQRQRES